MTVTAPGPLVALAELTLLEALPLPASAKAPSAAPRATDQVALGPPPTAQTLWKLAVSGSQQLETLLPMLERAIRETTAEPLPSAVGHLARAVGEAAHRIDAGSADLLTATGSDTVDSRPAAKLPPKDAPDLPEHAATAASDAVRQTAKPVLNTASTALPRANAEAVDTGLPSPKILPEDAQELPGRPDIDPERKMAKLLLNDAAPPPPRPDADVVDAPRQSTKSLLHDASSLLARPDGDAADAWRQSARLSLTDASDLLARAEQRFDPAQHPEMLWALTQVVGAQRYVTAALGTLGRSRAAAPIGAPRSSRLGFNPSGALAIVGMAMLLLVFGVAYGLWVGMGAAIAAAAALTWTWRTVVSARGVRLELRSTSPPPPASPAAAQPPQRPR